MRRSHPIAPRVIVGWTVAAFSLGLGLAAQAPPATGGWQTLAQVTQGFDSNVLLSTSQPQASATTLYSFSLGRVWAGPRGSFSASFQPQGEMFAGRPALNYLAESYQQVWSYAWPHTALTWTTSAERMPERARNMMSTGSSAESAGSPLALAMVVSGGTSTLSLMHQTSPRSRWRVNAVTGLQVFTQDLTLLANLLPDNPLRLQFSSRTRSAGGGLGWTYELTPQRSITLSTNASQMWYSHPAQALLYTSVEAELSQQIGSGLSLNVSAGPAWNRVLNAAAGSRAALPGSSYTAAAGLSWQHNRSQYGLSWNRSEQSSLVPGGVTTQVVGLHYQREWGRAWSAGVGGGFSQFAGLAGGGRNGTDASAQISDRVAAGLSLVASAGYDVQSLPAGGGGVLPLRRTAVSLSLTYQPGGAR